MHTLSTVKRFDSWRGLLVRKFNKHSSMLFIIEHKWSNEYFNEKILLNCHHCDYRLNTKDYELIFPNQLIRSQQATMC